MSTLKDITVTVCAAEVRPEAILDIFLSRGEEEVVANPRRLRQLRIVEQGDGEYLPERR